MRKSLALELAVLGLLADAPLHGYELRKRLTLLLGTRSAVSFGALYPALRSLSVAGWIAQLDGPIAADPASPPKRARITYAITAAGRQRFRELLAASGPETWDDEGFKVRFVFFNVTGPAVRRRILTGRRSLLAERKAALSQSLAASREQRDHYPLELHRHGVEGIERELRWVGELIADEEQPTRSAG